MRHAMPLRFIVAALSVGAAVAVADSSSSDKVTIAATGALVSSRTHSEKGSLARRGGGEGNPNDTPFEVDIPNVQANSIGAGLASAVSAPRADGSPFEVDTNYMPFVPDDGKVTGSASDIQEANAAVVNDSPFVLESKAAPAASHGEVPAFVVDTGVASAASAPTAAAASTANSPFVVDMEASPSKSTVEQDDLEDAAATSGAAAKKDAGTFTIVRTGEGQPGQRADTTSFEMSLQEQTTTAHPTTSAAFRFELGDSLLEVGAGQMFVEVPGTPFEVERHVAESFARKKRTIELVRSGVEVPPAVLAQSERKLATATPHVAQRLMRNEELQGPVIASALQSTLMLNSQEASADMPTDDKPTIAHEDKLTQEAAKATVAAPPIHSQNTVDAPGTRPSVQLPPGDDAGSGNSSLSTPDDHAPGSLINHSIPDLTGNASANGTATHVPKYVSTKGAIVSITLGLFITVFFVSALLCAINAGIKDVKESEEKEHTRPTAVPYRQLLIAQQQPEAAQAPVSPQTPVSPPASPQAA